MPALLIAQRTEGLTYKPDNWFTTPSAWENARKKHPDITIEPELKSPAIREKKAITYNIYGKQVLNLDLFAPVDRPNGIAVIIIHGGGWRSGQPAQHHPLAQHLAALGYTCFTPEYRLSTHALFPAAVYDIKAAIRHVRYNADRYRIDTGKIAVLGFSAGGTLAALMGTTGNMPLFEGTYDKTGLSSAVQAVVDIDGTLSFVHPQSREGDDSKRISAATHWFGYSKAENPALWQAASPLGYVSRFTPPTLFLNSAEGPAAAGQAEYIARLQQYGTPAEAHDFTGAPHAFCLFRPWFGRVVSLTHAFLQKVLGKE
jgi:acetyl esterase/lipase